MYTLNQSLYRKSIKIKKKTSGNGENNTKKKKPLPQKITHIGPYLLFGVKSV